MVSLLFYQNFKGYNEEVFKIYINNICNIIRICRQLFFFNLALNPNVEKEFILNQDKVKIEDEYEKKASIWFDENSKNIELETSYGLQKDICLRITQIN